MSKRLGGGKIKIEGDATQVYVHCLSGMAEAVDRYRLRISLDPARAGSPRRQRITTLEPVATRQMLEGNDLLPSILSSADRLIDDVLAIDPRLVRKAAWVRSEEGLDACAALVSQGDDRPCFDRRKLRLADRATSEPLRIVISTDSKAVTAEHAIAFIAAAKIAQQFRPLEIWWQGAWLLEQGPHKGCGHVFLVPLVNGDLDFRRMQFVLSSDLRDHASYCIMFSYAYPKTSWGGGVAEQSYLPDTHHFISEKGIEHSPQAVANYAAQWAGFEPLWAESVSAYEAAQYWAPPQSRTTDAADTRKEQAERMRQWDRERKQEEQVRTKAAKERANDIL